MYNVNSFAFLGITTKVKKKKKQTANFVKNYFLYDNEEYK